MEDVLQFIALLVVLPYIVGIPLTIVWWLLAILMWKATGWKGLMPADVWCEMERAFLTGLDRP